MKKRAENSRRKNPLVIHKRDIQFLVSIFVLLAQVTKRTIQSFHRIQEKSLSLSCWSSYTLNLSFNLSLRNSRERIKALLLAAIGIMLSD